MKSSRLLLSLSVMSALGLAACGSANGSSAAACPGFEGKTITFVVPYSAGGGFDIQARLLAPELEDALGATIVVENHPGAGGLLALNELVTARPDGRTIAITNGTGTFGAYLGGADGVQFDPRSFGFLASAETTPNVITTSAQSEYPTFDDLLASPGATFASVGPGASDYLNVAVLNAVYDLGAEAVAGYEGTSETVAATSKGETDAMSSNLDSLESAVDDGSQNLVLVLGREKLADYPDVPLASDVGDLDEEKQGLLDAHIDLLDIARPIVTPPGVGDEQLDALRCSFDDVAQDQDFMDMAADQGLVGLTSGEEIVTRVEEFTSTVPDGYVDVLESAF